METLLGVFLGLSLSATCGFRIFVPLLVVSAGAWSGHITPAPSFAWVGSTPALIALAVATVLEAVAYLVPWLDHALDVIALPLAAVAGTVLTGGLVLEMSPFLKWGLAAVAGGGLAVGTHLAMATARAGSTATSGGTLNPIFAVAESVAAVFLSILAVVAPILAFVAVVLVVVAFVVAAGKVRQLVAGRSPTKSVPTELA